jgi:hypothetical protein
MSQSTLGRLWNRLTNRYEQDAESDCCSVSIEEVPSDTEETESDSCCE